MSKTIKKENFGRTGHESSRLIFGGAALSRATEREADRVLDLLLEYGVNHIDTSVTYGDSEKHISRWLKRSPGEFFLATKIDARTYAEAKLELEKSLDILGVDRVDLLQMHELVEDGDTDTFLGKNGALRVLEEAKMQGLAEYVGVTSHGFNAPRVLSRCLMNYPFDSVLLPFNYLMSIHHSYRSDFDALALACREKGTVIQTMKSVARGPWNGVPKNRTTWYRPLEEAEDIRRAVHWVMGFDGLFFTSCGDTSLLPLVLDAAASYEGRPPREEMEEMRERLGMMIPPQHTWPRLGA